MAYSYTRYTSNGSTTNYTFPFPYIATTDIYVRLNGVLTTAFTFLSTSSIALTTAPVAGVIIEIRRTTSLLTPIVNFTDGSVLLERDLDLSVTFDLYIAQETTDSLTSSMTKDSLGVFQGQSVVLANLADPVSSQDAATKSYVDSLVPTIALSNAVTQKRQDFPGTGAQTTFTLSSAPLALNNTQVFINGVYQSKTGYSLSGTTLTFSEAPRVNASIEVMSVATLASAETDAAASTYQPAGTGAVATTVQAKLRQVVSVMDFGAVADGNDATGAGTNNSTAFNLAIATLGSGGSLYIPAGVYKLNTQVSVPENFAIIGSGPWTTRLFAPTAFNGDGIIKLAPVGGNPASIRDLAIVGQVGGCGANSICLNLNGNGSIGTNVWIAGMKTGVRLGSTSCFLYNSVIDSGMASGVGIQIDSYDTIVSNVQIYSNYIGVSVSSVAYADTTVTLSNIQCVQCAYRGFSISSSSNIQIDNCSVGDVTGSVSFTNGGIVIDTSSNVNISNFIGKIFDKQTSGNGGIYCVNSSKVNVSNSQVSNFYNGVKATGGADITVTGGTFSENADNGITITGSNRALISGNSCNDNGTAGGTTNSGILSDNTSSSCLHNLIGNICSQAGGGVQDYGIYSNVTNNGGSSGFTNITGNMTRYNNTGQITTAGLTANIQQTANY